MEQSEQINKVAEIGWPSIVIIVIIAGLCLFFGIKTSRLSAKDEANIAKQSVLASQRDTAYAKVLLYAKRVNILEADVKEANSNTNDATNSMANYRKKYNELRNKPEVHDTVKVLECDDLLVRSDNFITILKANVASYSRLADTLQLENKYLTDSYQLCLTLSKSQAVDLTATRGKLRRSKILNWGEGGVVGGLTVGMVVVLLSQ